MNKIPFQNNTVIPPEWLNAIQNLSYEKEPGEAGYIPNPNDVFHFQQWKTFFTTTTEESPTCTVDFGTWERNVILRSPYPKPIYNPTGLLRNAVLIVIPDFPVETGYIMFSKNPGYSIQIPKGNIGFFFFRETGTLEKAFPLPCSSSITNVFFNLITASAANIDCVNTTNISSTYANSVNLGYSQSQDKSFILDPVAELYLTTQVEYETAKQKTCPIIYLSNFLDQGGTAGCTEFTLNKVGEANGKKVGVMNAGGTSDITVHSSSPDFILKPNTMAYFITDSENWYKIT